MPTLDKNQPVSLSLLQQGTSYFHFISYARSGINGHDSFKVKGQPGLAVSRKSRRASRAHESDDETLVRQLALTRVGERAPPGG